MSHLIDLGVCTQAGCTNFITLQNYLKNILLVHFWMFKIVLQSKCPLLGERPNESTAKQLKYAKRV